MKFIMDDKARETIINKGGILIIKLATCRNWTGLFQSLWSEAGAKAPNEDNYNKYEHQGITIYIDKKLQVQDQVEIKLKPKLPLFGPGFRISGINIWRPNPFQIGCNISWHKIPSGPATPDDYPVQR